MVLNATGMPSVFSGETPSRNSQSLPSSLMAWRNRALCACSGSGKNSAAGEKAAFANAAVAVQARDSYRAANGLQSARFVRPHQIAAALATALFGALRQREN